MYILSYNFWLHLISFLEDGSETCCCDNTDDCCWDRCNKTNGINADANCKEGVEKDPVKFQRVYWAAVNNTDYSEGDYSILIGQRIKVKLGKFYI